LPQLTYRELAERLGLTPDGARNLARRRMWTVALGNDKLARVMVGEAELVAEAGRISRSTAGERPVSGTDDRPVSGDRERLANGPDATALAELLAALRDLRAENAELRDRASRADRAEGELAAEQRRNAELAGELRAALAKAEARADRLEAALAEARRPWLARVLEGLRRKG
jgi:hypothetical protein